MEHIGSFYRSVDNRGRIVIGNLIKTDSIYVFPEPEALEREYKHVTS